MLDKLARQRAGGRSVGRQASGGARRMLLVAGGWALLIGCAQLYAWQHMLRPLELLQALVRLCSSHPAGPLLFIGAAALSPLLLIPAALLGSVAGLCFGPVLGVALTLAGCNLSALLTYGLGRLAGRGGVPSRLGERYGGYLRQNAFLSVVVLRLSFLPYDPVNYLIGLMRVPCGRFLLANTLGSLPGVIAIVLAGSAVQGLEQGLPMVNLPTLLGAAALVGCGVALALLLRRRA